MCEAQNQILEVFWWFDDKGKGVITRKELARVLRSLSPDWDDQQVDRLVDLANPDRDGFIKYREFVSWLMGTGDVLEDAPKGRCQPPELGPSLLEAKRREADALANQIARDTELAERAAAEANELLEAALPALDAAREALDGLADAELAALAALPEPPAPVAAVAAGLRALGPGARWPEAGGAPAEAAGLRVALRDFNKDGVKAEQVDVVRRLLSDGGDLMSDAAVQRMQAMSLAGHALLLWLRAVVRYFEAAKAATPKFELVNKLHQSMWRAEAALTRINEEVEGLME